MMLRRIARPMLAAWFVTEGSAAVRGAAVHVEPARAAADALVERFGITSPTDDQLRTIVKAHGAATIGAGAALAIGKAPRLAALVLAALTLPAAVASLLASRRGGVSAAAKNERRQRAVRAVSFTGAALIAAADREGRPGLAWKVSRARKLAAAGASATVAGAKKADSVGAGGTLKKVAKGAGAVAAAKAAKNAGTDAGHGATETATGGKRAQKKAAKADAKALKATKAADKKAAKSAAVAEATAAKLAAEEAASAEKAARVAEAQAAKVAKATKRSRRKDEDVVLPG